jgi:uncharacterized DUF497 family protein
VTYEWDENKNAANKLKHGLSLEEAAYLFDLPAQLILEEYDFEHSIGEDRILSIGSIARGIVVVITTERNGGNVIRLISARFATINERRRYFEFIAGV